MHKARHENVVEVFGLIEMEDFVGIVMEYVRYGSLVSAISIDEKLSPLLRLRMCCDIASGIAHLHFVIKKRLIVHGDIKLENVLLSNTLRCKIADFGCANIKTISTLRTSTGSRSVKSKSDKETEYYRYITTLYAAPEVLADSMLNPDSAQDVYSFSVIGTELIGWKRPRDIKNYEKDIKKGERPKLNEIGFVQKIDRQGDESTKKIFGGLIDVIKNCRKQYPKERPPMSEVETKLKKLWKQCNERAPKQIEIDVERAKKALDVMVPAIRECKESRNLIPMTQFVSNVLQLPFTSGNA